MEIGDEISTWFSGNESGKSTVIGIYPYTGMYKNLFNVVLRLTAERTNTGWLELPYKIEVES